MNLITMSAIAVTLFLGGPVRSRRSASSPRDGIVNVWIMPVFWFFAKLLVLLYGTVWVRASLPAAALRPAHGPRVEVAHRARVPLGHGVRVIIIGREEGWNRLVVVPAAVLGALLVLGFLRLCMPKPGEVMDEGH